jgi:hypothetical protein
MFTVCKVYLFTVLHFASQGFNAFFQWTSHRLHLVRNGAAFQILRQQHDARYTRHQKTAQDITRHHKTAKCKLLKRYKSAPASSHQNAFVAAHEAL